MGKLKPYAGVWFQACGGMMIRWLRLHMIQLVGQGKVGNGPSSSAFLGVLA